MLRYSPISNRNHRVSTTPPFHITPTNTTTATTYAAGYLMQSGSSRRRDSINSSVGATSLRRLLTANRGCRNKIPLHVRAKVAKNFTFLVLAHGLMYAVLIPLFGLQVLLFDLFIITIAWQYLLAASFSFLKRKYIKLPMKIDMSGLNIIPMTKYSTFLFAGIKFAVVSPRILAT